MIRQAAIRPVPGALALLLALAIPGSRPEAGRELTGPRRGESALPLLVSLVHHHSTRGIQDHALPILSAAGGRGTLGLLVLELEKTSIPPAEISTVDTPGGLGNIQPISHGPPDADGLYTGRLHAANPAGFMTDSGIREIATAGWELAFHGVDHTTQTGILGQVDGEGKLRRAYQAGILEIRRILGDPSHPVRTNTLASNAWSPDVRDVARDLFDWTEVRWGGGVNHAPVAYSRLQQPHAGFNSIDFNRQTYDGLQDLDELVRLARTDGGCWLIVQVHDVVDDLAQSPDPQRAMLTGEYAYLVQRLAEAGARFMTFSEGAEAVARDNPGNHLRNTRFAGHGFFTRPADLPLDWFPVPDAAAGGTVTFPGEDTVRLDSPAPSLLGLRQRISPELFLEPAYVLRARVDLAGMTAGTVRLTLRGPLGERAAHHDPATGTFCLELTPAEIAPAAFAEGEVYLEVRATSFVGVASLSGFELLPLRRRWQDCSRTGKLR